MRKIVFILIFVSEFLFYGCGGGGGNESHIFFKLSECQVSPTLISKSDPLSITFSWKVDNDNPESIYYIDIYLSQDKTLDNSDTLIAQYTSRNVQDKRVLNPNDPFYQTLLDAYGGRYYIIFDAYLYDNSEVAIHSIKATADFVLKTKWTVMIYMDGDNSLSSASITDLNDVEKVGSTNNINMVVERDTSSDTTKRYYIIPGQSILLKDLGELNMGDKQTLIDFAHWVIFSYPANHYMLILWNHGGGFKKRFLITRNIFTDVTSNDASMSIPDLADALSTIKQEIGYKIDIVGIDACLMGMLEVAYEIKDLANFMIASENTEPYDGWPYKDILEFFKDNIDRVSENDLCKNIVADYIASYGPYDEATLSAIDLTKVSDLEVAVNNLSNDLINDLNQDNSSLKNILQTTIYNNVQRFDDGSYPGISAQDDSYVDLYDLMSLIKEDLPNYQIDAQKVIDTIKTTIIANGNTGGPVGKSYGISIWFPNPNNYSNYNWINYWEHYTELRFSKDSSWDELIDNLWN